MQSALDGDLRNISFASLPTATKRLSSYINLLQQPNQQDSARDQIRAKMVAELDSDTGSGGLALVLARLELDIAVNDFVQAAKTGTSEEVAKAARSMRSYCEDACRHLSIGITKHRSLSCLAALASLCATIGPYQPGYSDEQQQQSHGVRFDQVLTELRDLYPPGEIILGRKEYFADLALDFIPQKYLSTPYDIKTPHDPVQLVMREAMLLRQYDEALQACNEITPGVRASHRFLGDSQTAVNWAELWTMPLQNRLALADNIIPLRGIYELRSHLDSLHTTVSSRYTKTNTSLQGTQTKKSAAEQRKLDLRLKRAQQEILKKQQELIEANKLADRLTGTLQMMLRSVLSVNTDGPGDQDAKERQLEALRELTAVDVSKFKLVASKSAGIYWAEDVAFAFSKDLEQSLDDGNLLQHLFFPDAWKIDPAKHVHSLLRTTYDDLSAEMNTAVIEAGNAFETSGVIAPCFFDAFEALKGALADVGAGDIENTSFCGDNENTSFCGSLLLGWESLRDHVINRASTTGQVLQRDIEEFSRLRDVFPSSHCDEVDEDMDEIDDDYGVFSAILSGSIQRKVAALFDEQLQSLFKKAGVRVHEKLGEAKDLLAQSILQQTNDACSEPHDARDMFCYGLCGHLAVTALLSPDDENACAAWDHVVASMTLPPETRASNDVFSRFIAQATTQDSAMQEQLRRLLVNVEWPAPAFRARNRGYSELHYHFVVTFLATTLLSAQMDLLVDDLDVPDAVLRCKEGLLQRITKVLQHLERMNCLPAHVFGILESILHKKQQEENAVTYQVAWLKLSLLQLSAVYAMLCYELGSVSRCWTEMFPQFAEARLRFLANHIDAAALKDRGVVQLSREGLEAAVYMGREPESSPAHILGQKQTPERARKDRVSSQHQHQQKEQQRQRHHLPQHISAEGIEDSPLSLENSLKALAGAAISVGDLEVELNFLREKLSLGLVGGDEAVDDATSDAASVDTLIGYTAVLQMLWDYYNTAQRVAALFDQRWAELQSRGIALGLLSESLPHEAAWHTPSSDTLMNIDVEEYSAWLEGVEDCCALWSLPHLAVAVQQLWLETKAAELDLHLRKAQAEENIRSFQDHDSHLDVFVARNQHVKQARLKFYALQAKHEQSAAQLRACMERRERFHRNANPDVQRIKQCLHEVRFLKQQYNEKLVSGQQVQLSEMEYMQQMVDMLSLLSKKYFLEQEKRWLDTYLLPARDAFVFFKDALLETRLLALSMLRHEGSFSSGQVIFYFLVKAVLQEVWKERAAALLESIDLEFEDEPGLTTTSTSKAAKKKAKKRGKKAAATRQAPVQEASRDNGSDSRYHSAGSVTPLHTPEDVVCIGLDTAEPHGEQQRPAVGNDDDDGKDDVLHGADSISAENIMLALLKEQEQHEARLAAEAQKRRREQQQGQLPTADQGIAGSKESVSFGDLKAKEKKKRKEGSVEQKDREHAAAGAGGISDGDDGFVVPHPAAPSPVAHHPKVQGRSTRTETASVSGDGAQATDATNDNEVWEEVRTRRGHSTTNTDPLHDVGERHSKHGEAVGAGGASLAASRVSVAVSEPFVDQQGSGPRPSRFIEVDGRWTCGGCGKTYPLASGCTKCKSSDRSAPCRDWFYGKCQRPRGSICRRPHLYFDLPTGPRPKHLEFHRPKPHPDFLWPPKQTPTAALSSAKKQQQERVVHPVKKPQGKAGATQVPKTSLASMVAGPGSNVGASAPSSTAPGTHHKKDSDPKQTTLHQKQNDTQQTPSLPPVRPPLHPSPHPAFSQPSAPLGASEASSNAWFRGAPATTTTTVMHPATPPLPPPVSSASSSPATWARPPPPPPVPVPAATQDGLPTAGVTSILPPPPPLPSAEGEENYYMSMLSTLGIEDEQQQQARPSSPHPLPHLYARFNGTAMTTTPFGGVNAGSLSDDGASAQGGITGWHDHAASVLSHAQPGGSGSGRGSGAMDYLASNASAGAGPLGSIWPSPGQNEEDAAMAFALEQSLKEQFHVSPSARATGLPLNVDVAPGRAASLPSSSSVTAPGLANETGEYNCFLNVVVQCLWYCSEFRAQVALWPAHLRSADPVVHALHGLFEDLAGAAIATPAAMAVNGNDQQRLPRSKQQRLQQQQQGATTVVNPTPLREALAALPCGRFAVGEMADAGELLLTLYERINAACSAIGIASVVDSVLGVKLSQAVHCQTCGKSTHETSHLQYFMHVSATALRMMSWTLPLGSSMGAALRAVEAQDQKSCDEDGGGCGRLNHVNNFMETNEAPRVFALELGWESHQEESGDIAATLNVIQEHLDLADVFQAVEPGALRYRLRSMVAYYGQHYQALVLSRSDCRWVLLDDAKATAVGSWQHVVNKCEVGRIQPSVLFYEAE